MTKVGDPIEARLGMKAPPPTPRQQHEGSVQPAQRDSLSVAKDISTIAQSLAAILALVAGALWFFAEKPYAAAARGSVKVEHRVGSNHFFDVHAEFENAGKVPLRFDCFVIHIYAEDQVSHVSPPEKSYCKGSVKQLSSGEVISFERSVLENELPPNFGKALSFHVALADPSSDGKWLEKASASDSLLSPD